MCCLNPPGKTVRLFMLLILIMVVAPSRGPLNVWGASLTPHNIELHWDPPSPDDQNGHIVSYLINITHIDSGETLSFEVPGNSSYFSGSEFHPYYTYSCTVHAVTVSTGPGTLVNVTTEEAGKFQQPLHCRANC